jgi:nicotinate dehydrogenase subunit A
MSNASAAVVKPVRLTVNGQSRELHLPEDTSMLMILRQDLELKGTRIGCAEGNCGACTVLMDGTPVQTCTMPLWAAAGRSFTTIEAAAEAPVLAAVRAAFLTEQAAQCGYCTNGIIMSVAGLLAAGRDRAAIIHHLDERHLCRCGAQPRILRAIDRAMASLKGSV